MASRPATYDGTTDRYNASDAHNSPAVSPSRTKSRRISAGTRGHWIRHGSSPCSRDNAVQVNTPAITVPAMPTRKHNRSGSGAHCASTPASTGPDPLPSDCASPASIAGRRVSRCGSISTRAAVAGPLISPTAIPCSARATYSQRVPSASANTTSATPAASSPARITGRRPNRSASRPHSNSVATSVTAYIAKTVVSTIPEKPNRSAYTA